MTREETIRLATGLRTDFKCVSETMVDFCNTIIQALEQTRWIPVSERLPDEYDLVLVTEKYGFVDTARFVHNDFTEMDEWIVADDETIDVIAWMPLPGPYEGESEE